MALLFANNAVSTLASSVNIGATSLTVQAGDGNLFPNPTGNDSFLITLQDASNNIEIVECTSRATDAMTIVRAREGTADQAWLAGDSVELRITAGVLSQYRQGVGDAVVDTGINKSLGAGDVHDIINATAAVTITLLSAATAAEGYQVTIRNSSTGPVTIDRANAADTINGVLQNISIPAGDSVVLSVNQNENGYVTLPGAFTAAWPVGSIYLSTTAANPSTTMGFGTWVRIAEGRTLIGEGTGAGLTARTAGTEIGQEDAIIPEHTHTITDPAHRHGTDVQVVDAGIYGGAGRGGTQIGGQGAWSHTATTGITIDSTGEAVTDKNMQPSLVVYIWERTA